MKRPIGIVVGIALLAGCGGAPTTVKNNSADIALAAARQTSSAAENQDVAALRAVTAPFHRLSVAKSAGYDTQFPAGCFTSDSGGMGFHYIDNSNVGTLEVTKPQLLVYEPERNGDLDLVAVEYIVPGTPQDTPPRLFGRNFTYNTMFGVWALHVWAWKHNPSGLYANWNPRVSCRFAEAGTVATHH